MGAAHDIPQTITIVTKITDHHNKYNNDGKFEILLELPNVTQRHKVSKVSCWKNGADRFAQHGVATNLEFVKKKNCSICKVQ